MGEHDKQEAKSCPVKGAVRAVLGKIATNLNTKKAPQEPAPEPPPPVDPNTAASIAAWEKETAKLGSTDASNMQPARRNWEDFVQRHMPVVNSLGELGIASA